MSSSRVSDLIVAQREEEQSPIEAQALRGTTGQRHNLTGQEENTRGTNKEPVVGFYTWAIWAAPASPIELKARLSDSRFLLVDLVVESREPIRRALVTPIRLFLRDKWVRLETKETHTEESGVCVLLCVCVCVNRGLFALWSV